MTAVITSFTPIDAECKEKKLKLDVNLEKTGPDVDVIKMWIRDECVLKHGFDLEHDFIVKNLDTLVNKAKAIEKKAATKGSEA